MMEHGTGGSARLLVDRNGDRHPTTIRVLLSPETSLLFTSVQSGLFCLLACRNAESSIPREDR